MKCPSLPRLRSSSLPRRSPLRELFPHRLKWPLQSRCSLTPHPHRKTRVRALHSDTTAHVSRVTAVSLIQKAMIAVLIPLRVTAAVTAAAGKTTPQVTIQAAIVSPETSSIPPTIQAIVSSAEMILSASSRRILISSKPFSRSRIFMLSRVILPNPRAVSSPLIRSRTVHIVSLRQGIQIPSCPVRIILQGRRVTTTPNTERATLPFPK